MSDKIHKSCDINKDYEEGMKFLLNYSKLKHYSCNIRQHRWIPSFCYELAKEGACLKFWKAVKAQHRLKRLSEITITPRRHPFASVLDEMITWSLTDEGSIFWIHIYHNFKKSTTPP